MTLTALQLNRATLARQLLLRREPLGVVDGVRRVLALQAQHPASPYLALWNRLAGLDPAAVDAAFTAQSLVKGTLMRVTLHAVAADDHRTLHTAMQPTLRGSRLADPRFTVSGLSAGEAEALVPELMRFADRPRTAAQVQGWLADRFRHRAGADGAPGADDASAAVWWALRSFAPLRHAPTGGPWSFGPRPSYVAASTSPSAGPLPPGAGGPITPATALPTLVRRYLQAFGPASVADAAQFTRLPRSRIRQALDDLTDGVRRLTGEDGTELWDVADGWVPAADTPAPPRLMAMWDTVLLAYADRSRIVPPDLRRVVTRPNGDVLPTLLVDGYVAGVWRAVAGGIEATAFRPLPDDAWAGLAAEAHDLVTLLAGREPEVYRRYGHWWASLPPGDVRLLAG